MPFFALANWNWGGRLHPLYYNLSIATKALLGLAIMICRLVVLRHSEHEEDQEKGFVGNTILLTQPRPQEIMQTLPPADDEVSNYLSVCFNNQKMTTADVGKHEALKIDPQEYIRCSEFRKKSLSCICRGADRQGETSDTVARESGAGSHPTKRSRHGHIAHLQADS